MWLNKHRLIEKYGSAWAYMVILGSTWVYTAIHVYAE